MQVVNRTFRLGQQVIANGQVVTFRQYCGYERNQAGETIATKGVIDLGNGKHKIVSMEVIKPIGENT